MYKTLVYTLVNGTSKTAKITKGDIARITLTVPNNITFCNLWGVEFLAFL